MFRKILVLTGVVICTLACTKENESHKDSSLEMRGISPYIQGAGELTRAVSYKTIGRTEFVADDELMITKLRRTEHFYEEYLDGIPFQFKNSLWSRTTKVPEKIYWADPESGHTIIAYSEPNYSSYKDKFKLSGRTYYSSLGEPAATTPIDYSSDIELLKTEDLLISYSEEVQPNINASIMFSHGLAQLRLAIDIREFSQSSSVVEEDLKVYNLVIKNMPCLYKWDQSSASTKQPTTAVDESVIDSFWPGVTIDKKRDIIPYMTAAAGEGSGINKQFVYYSMAVPADMDYVDIEFTVDYTNPLDRSVRIVKDFTARVVNGSGKVQFKAGYCTNINVSLNHRGEPVVMGVHFVDWKYGDDQSNSYLRKNSLYMTTTSRDSVTTFKDGGVNVENATWLYKESGVVVDFDGHTGDSLDDPYIIASAMQLLSFAYEVKEGYNFENKYVVLDAEIILQENVDSTKLLWIGVGSESRPFNGYFYCKAANVLHHNGSPFFMALGSKAVVEGMHLSTHGVVGRGAIAEKCSGLIFASSVVGDVANPLVYAGGVVGNLTSTGTLVACSHVGDLSAGSGPVGGIVGENKGIVAACYHAGKLEGTDAKGGAAGSNTATISGCFYDSTLATPSYNDGSVGYSSVDIKKNAMVGSADLSNESPDNLNGALHLWVKNSSLSTDLKERINAHHYEFRVAEYPYIN